MGKKKRLTPPRVVLDSNCVISALIFSHGRLVWLREAWMQGRFIPLVSKETARELIRVLAYPKFRLSESEQETLLGDYLPYAETVVVDVNTVGLPELRDPHDLKFLALAVAARADALVTGDSDLKDIEQDWKESLVMSAMEFKEWLHEHHGRGADT